MPSFFQFTQGTESRVRPNDSSPLLGRFRAVPPREGLGPRRPSQLGLLSDRLGNGRGSVHVSYGAVFAGGFGDDAQSTTSDDDFEDGRPYWERAWQGWIVDLWVDPRQSAVKRVVEKWWSRYGFLVLLPAALAVIWCSIPFPQYQFPDYEDDDGSGTPKGRKTPGHGAARVQVNFWFFLFVYYGFYNLTALIWITKVFNLYSLNWWPRSLGFPLTVSLIAMISLAAPVPVYLNPSTRYLTMHNTAWISWTFVIMALPVGIAFFILTINERHVGLRHSLSETQRIFTTSWWTGEPDTLPRRDRRRRNAGDTFDQDFLQISAEPRPQAAGMRRNWLPASFVRFLWFCVALFVGLMAYVIGEAYAEIYLRTLPHDNLETVVYVYGWVATVHLLDALTGWVLGIREGERVGSYPLSWVFKLYFMLTYQTYVRALYARLRSPQQFIILQVLSSTGLVVITPIMMTPIMHKILTMLGFNSQSYGSYQKLQTRNVFIRFLAENVSMVTFLGSILVLHFGANQDVYPYFAFDGENEQYNFNLTFYASMVTWACELVASLAVRGLISVFFGVDVGLEGKLDLAVWPELLPTCVAVMLHVLQNMLFSIIRLQFR
ncbi:Fc.00g020580.m01.CDS01 [Cosmosporella sp. VM-42]